MEAARAHERAPSAQSDTSRYATPFESMPESLATGSMPPLLEDGGEEEEEGTCEQAKGEGARKMLTLFSLPREVLALIFSNTDVRTLIRLSETWYVQWIYAIQLFALKAPNFLFSRLKLPHFVLFRNHGDDIPLSPMS